MRVLFSLTLLLVIAIFYPTNSSAKVAPLEADFQDFFGVDVEEDGHQRTIAGLKRAIEADPHDYENYGRLAFVYDYIGDYENALEALKLVQKDPVLTDPRHSLLRKILKHKFAGKFDIIS